MSGIAGMVGRVEPVDRGLLEEMTSRLSFRGPDAQHVWIDGRVGLGHALLETVDDTAPKAQPLTLDGRVWVTADARIDDRANLVGRLPADTQAAAEATDAELILRAYRAWGVECTAHLIGDYAFAIWDGPEHRLFCARDQLGCKPLFYAALPDGLVFGSSLDCVRRHPGVFDRLNDQAIADFLLFGYNAEADTTAFAGIRRLPPAHALVWTPDSLRVRRYWTMPIREPLTYKRDADYVDQFSSLLRAAVSDRLRTRRVGVMMSGGLDSSSIAAEAHSVLRAGGRPFELRASTIVFDSLIPDEERHYASLVAARLDIPIDFEIADSYKLFERRAHRLFHAPEPRSLASAAREVDRLEKAAAHSRVVLTGQGGDILLRPSATFLVDALKRLEFARCARAVVGHWSTYGRLPRLGIRSRIRELAGVTRIRQPYPSWIEPELSERLDLPGRWKAVHALDRTPVDHHRPEAYRLLVQPWFRVFEAFDPNSTGVSLEFRHPLFDLRLLDFALRVPSLPWCVDKALLRETMRGKLPEEVRLRPKAPLAGDPRRRLFGDSGAEWLIQIPESRLLKRYIYPGFINSSGSGQPEASVEAVALGFRPYYLNFWLHSLEVPSEATLTLREPIADRHGCV
jgi:asparagine synthase (glutamine-hydrolysing)